MISEKPPVKAYNTCSSVRDTNKGGVSTPPIGNSGVLQPTVQIIQDPFRLTVLPNTLSQPGTKTSTKDGDNEGFTTITHSKAQKKIINIKKEHERQVMKEVVKQTLNPKASAKDAATSQTIPNRGPIGWNPVI
jgi:hypothetical protein